MNSLYHAHHIPIHNYVIPPTNILKPHWLLNTDVICVTKLPPAFVWLNLVAIFAAKKIKAFRVHIGNIPMQASCLGVLMAVYPTQPKLKPVT